MKTILVLTDFSIRADHAAHYALKLAQKIKANLLLCNVFAVPAANFISAGVDWPVENSEVFEEDSKNDLSELTERLNDILDHTSAADEFRPLIEQCSKAGSIINAINEIAASYQVLMAVVGMHFATGFGPFLSDDHTNEIIEKVNVPVLVVPNQMKFSNFDKIAFATDLTYRGIDVLHCLHGITKYFDSEILITYVADEKISDQVEHHNVHNFFNRAITQVKYPKIYYRAIHAKSIVSGLDWLSEHTDIDLLVLVHRKRNFLQKVFEGSITQKMASHLIKPMLVFPGGSAHETLPVF